jgi:hypothetical protein
VAIGVGPLFFWWFTRYDLDYEIAFVALPFCLGPYRKTQLL